MVADGLWVLATAGGPWQALAVRQHAVRKQALVDKLAAFVTGALVMQNTFQRLGVVLGMAVEP